MANPSKDKGTRWETAIVSYLVGRGLRARRKPPSGRFDKADLELDDVPGIVIEAKNTSRDSLAGWVDEAVAEAVNAGVPVGAVWHHRPKKGSPGDGYVTMSGDHFTSVLEELRDLREQVRKLVADLKLRESAAEANADWRKWHSAPED